MSHPEDVTRQRDELRVIGNRLVRGRPVPAAAFRAGLNARLNELTSSYPPFGRFRSTAFARTYLAIGSFLLGSAAIGIAGFGPFAA